MLLTAVMAPTLKSDFETKNNLKENNFNFGAPNYLKSRASRLGTNRYG